MNPVLQQALVSVLKWALTIAAGWFVRKGIWTDASATEYVAAAALALVTLGWTIYQRYHSRVETMTALAMKKGATLQDVKESIAAGLSASPNTPKDVPPVIVPGGKL